MGEWAEVHTMGRCKSLYTSFNQWLCFGQATGECSLDAKSHWTKYQSPKPASLLLAFQIWYMTWYMIYHISHMIYIYTCHISYMIYIIFDSWYIIYHMSYIAVFSETRFSHRLWDDTSPWNWPKVSSFGWREYWRWTRLCFASQLGTLFTSAEARLPLQDSESLQSHWSLRCS